MSSYKSIIRRIRRLPLSYTQLHDLLALLKSLYPTPKSKNYLKLLDNILVNEKFDDITHILDLLYKGSSPQWLKEFKHTNYLSLKSSWPQVHLINELTKDPSVLKKYQHQLQEESNEDISMVAHFGLSPGKREPIVPLVKYSSHTGRIDSMMNEAAKRYKFVFANQGLLSRSKIPVLEVIYPTNRLALPLHPAKRDRLLKEKVTSVKHTLELYKPITIEGLQEIYQLAIHKPLSESHHRDKPNNPSNKPNSPSNKLNSPSNKLDPLTINKNFFKYMEKKRQHEIISSMVQKHLRPKKLIPTDHNIRKIFRNYTMKQYYLEDDTYRMSWMHNFYENEGSMIEEFKKIKSN